MDLYYYCSYDGSPAGFHIGKVNKSDQSNECQELSDEHIEPFIRYCFETGLIRSAFGRIPTESDSQKKYFLLKKKMTGEKSDCKYYINIAVVVDEWDSFSSLMQKCDDEEKLVTAIMNSIEPSKDVSFGYKVNTRNLSAVFSFGDDASICNCNTTHSICNCNTTHMEVIQQNDATFITLLRENPNIDELKKCLGIDYDQTEIIHESGSMFRIEKKNISVWNQIIPMLIIVLAVVEIISMIMGVTL